MTREEFEKKSQDLLDEYNALQRSMTEKAEEIHSLKREWAVELCKKYEEFKDKKVRITFKEENRFVKGGFTTRSIEGFLLGFYITSTYRRKDIFPSVAKIKKDGTASKNCYCEYSIMDWTKIDKIEAIE